MYNITYHVMQYCNGSHWVAMGSIMGQGDGLGDHMAGQALDMGGFQIQNLAPPTADNHAATRAYVTTAIAAIPAPVTPNLSAVLAVGNAAGNRKITGLATPTVGTDAAHKTYVDGKFGALTNNQWCRGSGTQVICDQTAPSAMPSCPAGAQLISTSGGWQCSEACTYGAIGSVCASDNAIYIGLYEGFRLYAASSDETASNWQTAINNCTNKSPKGIWFLPPRWALDLLWINGNRISPPGLINLMGIGIDTNSYYWSSTEYTNTLYAWVQRFSDGNPSTSNKSNSDRVRCVRR